MAVGVLFGPPIMMQYSWIRPLGSPDPFPGRRASGIWAIALAGAVVLGAGHCQHSLGAGASAVLLNEVMSSNRSAFADERGRFSDWVELHNAGPASVNLLGTGLSDDPDRPFKWIFPEIHLEPNQHLVVFLSGEPLQIPDPDDSSPEMSLEPDAIPGLQLWLDAADSDTITVAGGRVAAWKDKSRRQADSIGDEPIAPNQIPGLQLWLDSLDPETVEAENSRLIRWLDKSGAGRHAESLSDEARPQYFPGGPRVDPVIWFGGINHALRFPRLDRIRTVVWVGRESPFAPVDFRPLLGDTEHYDFHRGVESQLFADRWTAAQVLDGTTWINRQKVDATRAVLTGERTLITTITTADARANLLSSDRLIPDRFWAGEIAEVAIYDRPLEPAERVGIEAWLEAKWGFEFHNDTGQTDPGRRPVLSTDPLTRQPVVWFDGVNDYLEFDRLEHVRTVFWVGYEDKYASDTFRPILGDAESFHFHRGGDGILYHERHALAADTGGSAWINGVPVDPATTRLPPPLSLITTRTPRSARVNNIASDRLLDGRFWCGGLGELLIYNRQLADFERRGIERHLLDKWRLPVRYLHANFSLRAGRETLILTDPAGVPIDRFPPMSIPENKSAGRAENAGAGGDWFPLDTPTPGAVNSSPAKTAFLAAPRFSPAAGLHPDPVRVELAAPEAPSDAVIRYTLDGSDPGTASPAYTEPVLITGNTVVRARVDHPDHVTSEAATGTYFIGESSTLPLVSFATDPAHFFDPATGIYVEGPNASPDLPHFGANYWQNWERPVHVEFFEPDGTAGFAMNAGIKIHGGWSRVVSQKSLRLLARSRYGPDAIDYPLFENVPAATFRRLILRSGGNDWIYTLTRDALMHRIGRPLGLDGSANRPAHVFLNGAYWGIHNIRERVDHHALAERYGLEPDQIDRLSLNSDIRSGDNAHFNALLEFVRTHDLAIREHYDYVARQVDVDNLIDYVALQIYFDNTDWPVNNVVYWRPRLPDGKWRWVLHDLDGCLGIRNTGASRDNFFGVFGVTHDFFLPPWPTYLFKHMLRDSGFRNRFIARYSDLMNDRFTPEKVLPLVDAFHDELEPEISRHIRRWGGQLGIGERSFASVAEWEANLEVIRRFIRDRATFAREHLRSFFDLPGEYTVHLNLEQIHGGSVTLNSLTFADPEPAANWTGTYPLGVPIRWSAAPAPGYRFAGWDGIDIDDPTSALITWTPDQIEALNVRPRFEPDPGFHPLVPRPWPLRDAPYRLGHFPAGTRAGTYPDSMTFATTAIADPDIAAEFAAPWTAPYDLDQRSRVVGLGDEGIGFINTGSGQSPGGGHVGTAILSLDTRDRDRVQVVWTGGTIEPNDRQYSIRLQYRCGSEGPYLDVSTSDGRPMTYTAHSAPEHSTVMGPVLLPDSANNQPLIQLRWVYHFTDTRGASGSRAFLRLDDIQVTGRQIGHPAPPIELSELLVWNVAEPGPYHAYPGWIEIRNTSTTRSWDLGGMTASDRLDRPDLWRFAPGTDLNPGSFLTVDLDPSRIPGASNTGFSAPRNGGRLFLFDSAARGGAILDLVQFGLSIPGYSIGRVVPTESESESNAANDAWMPAIPSAGSANVPAETGDVRSLTINEWSTESDWLELYNSDPLPVDLGGLYLSDDPSDPFRHRIADHSHIAGKGFQLFIASGAAAPDARHTGFRLSRNDDGLLLSTQVRTTIDSVAIDGHESAASAGRIPDGFRQIIPFQRQASPGASNARDSDMDTLPDGWELIFGLDPYRNDAHEDADRDRVDNLGEYLSGTDPVDHEDVLEVRDIVTGNNGEIVVRFRARAGRVYALEYRESLETGAWKTRMQYPATDRDEMVEIRDPAPESSRGFYRLRAHWNP